MLWAACSAREFAKIYVVSCVLSSSDLSSRSRQDNLQTNSSERSPLVSDVWGNEKEDAAVCLARYLWSQIYGHSRKWQIRKPSILKVHITVKMMIVRLCSGRKPRQCPLSWHRMMRLAEVLLMSTFLRKVS